MSTRQAKCTVMYFFMVLFFILVTGCLEEREFEKLKDEIQEPQETEETKEPNITREEIIQSSEEIVAEEKEYVDYVEKMEEISGEEYVEEVPEDFGRDVEVSTEPVKITSDVDIESLTTTTINNLVASMSIVGSEIDLLKRYAVSQSPPELARDVCPQITVSDAASPEDDVGVNEEGADVNEEGIDVNIDYGETCSIEESSLSLSGAIKATFKLKSAELIIRSASGEFLDFGVDNKTFQGTFGQSFPDEKKPYIEINSYVTILSEEYEALLGGNIIIENKDGLLVSSGKFSYADDRGQLELIIKEMIQGPECVFPVSAIVTTMGDGKVVIAYDCDSATISINDGAPEPTSFNILDIPSELRQEFIKWNEHILKLIPVIQETQGEGEGEAEGE